MGYTGTSTGIRTEYEYWTWKTDSARNDQILDLLALKMITGITLLTVLEYSRLLY